MNAEASSVRTAKRIGTAVPGPWSGAADSAAVRAATRLMMVPLRMLATPLGRRAAAAAVLSVALVAMVSSLYDHADPPVAASARGLAAVPAAAAKPAGASRGAGSPGAAAGAVTPAAPRAAQRPEDAATAWYAQQKRVPANRVKALQRQRLSATVMRVLVMADVSPSDMPTAFLTVRRGTAGWKVS